MGNGSTKSVNIFQKMESLSNHKYLTESGEKKNLNVKKIYCGNNHCIAQLDYDILTIWGENEFG